MRQFTEKTGGLASSSVEEVRGDVRRRSLTLVTSAWIFGSIFVTAVSGAPFAIFAKNLNATEFQIGLMSAIPFMASLVSMPAALWVDGTGKRKSTFLIALYASRLLWIPIALIPVWMMHQGSPMAVHAMSMFLILLLLMNIGQAVGAPAWVSWMADIVPDRSRGLYFARRRQLGILSAVPTALAVGLLLDSLRSGNAEPDRFTSLWWIAGIFLVASLPGLLDIHLFQYVPEVRPRNPRRVHLIKQFIKPLRDRQFLYFSGFVALLMFAVTFMGQFVTFYLIRKLNISSTQVQLILLVTPLIAQLAVLGLWGRMCDRFGKKPVLAIASLGLVPVGLGWCFMNSGLIWIGYLLSMGGAALWAGVEVANFNLALEMAGSREHDSDEEGGGSSYVAVNSVIINIAGCTSGVCAGLIASSLRDWSWDVQILGLMPFTYYEVLFLISAVLRMLAVVVFLPLIHEPEARPTIEALRFMTANLYNNAMGALMLPLRTIRIPKERDAEE